MLGLKKLSHLSRKVDRLAHHHCLAYRVIHLVDGIDSVIGFRR